MGTLFVIIHITDERTGRYGCQYLPGTIISHHQDTSSLIPTLQAWKSMQFSTTKVVLSFRPQLPAKNAVEDGVTRPTSMQQCHNHHSPLIHADSNFIAEGKQAG